MTESECDVGNVNELTRIMADLTLAAPAEEDKATIPIIKHLPELESISDDALLQVFWENRETINAYARGDV